MTFTIEFLPQDIPTDSGGRARLGHILIGDLDELFVSLLGLWTSADYTVHWENSVRRIVEARTQSCLITSLSVPGESDLIRWWLLYPYADEVRIQESMLLHSCLARPFDHSKPYALIPHYHQRTAEGKAISEWTIPLHDFEDFLKGPERERL